MREYLFGCFPLSGHSFGAALAHADAVPPASAGQERPLVVQFHNLADGAPEFSPRRIDRQTQILGPDDVALSRRADNLDFRQSSVASVIRLFGDAEACDVSEPL